MLSARTVESLLDLRIAERDAKRGANISAVELIVEHKGLALITRWSRWHGDFTHFGRARLRATSFRPPFSKRLPNASKVVAILDKEFPNG
jgi:hypothetical protein